MTMTSELHCRFDRLEAELAVTRDSIKAVCTWLHDNYSISIPDHVLKFRVNENEPLPDHQDSISIDFQDPLIDQGLFTETDIDDLEDYNNCRNIEDTLVKNQCKPCTVVLTRIYDSFLGQQVDQKQKPSINISNASNSYIDLKSRALKILNGFSYLTWPPGTDIKCPICPRIVTWHKTGMKGRYKSHLRTIHGFKFTTYSTIRSLKRIHNLDKYEVTHDLKQKCMELYSQLYSPLNDKILRNPPHMDCPICGLQIFAVTSVGQDRLKMRFRNHLKFVHKIFVVSSTKEFKTKTTKIIISTTPSTIRTKTISNHQENISNPQISQESKTKTTVYQIPLFKNQSDVCDRDYRTKALEILNGFSYMTWPPGQGIPCPYPYCTRVTKWYKSGMKSRFQDHLINLHGFKRTYSTIRSLKRVHQLDKYEVTEELKIKCKEIYKQMYSSLKRSQILRNPPHMDCPICGLQLLAVSCAGHDLLKTRFRNHLKFVHKFYVGVTAPPKQQKGEHSGEDLKLKKKIYYKEIVKKRYLGLTKTHLCSTCGATFKLPAQLRYHAMTHSDESPYACNLCDRRFKRPQSLANHKQLDHDHERKVCYKCGDNFTKKSFSRHLKHAHSEEKS